MSDTHPQSLIIRRWADYQDYSEKFNTMKNFTVNRQEDTADELWLLQHHAVLTQGQTGKPEHILIPSDIPVVQTDRGGQVTWHGPGQLIGYFLFDLNRLKWHVRDLVDFGENIMMWLLEHYQIESYTKKDAPGVYVHDRKIGSLGFKIRRGRSYHGIGLNIDCDLSGFQTINPCGYAGLEMVRFSDLLDQAPSFTEITDLCIQFIQQQNLYQYVQIIDQ